MCQYDNGSMLPAGETATSQGTAAVERMQSGRVQDSKTAVFAEEKVANGAGLTTDIFVYSNDTLRNLALDGEDTAVRWRSTRATSTATASPSCRVQC